MYHVPQVYNASDYLCKVTTEEIEVCKQECIFSDEEPICDEDVFELANLLMTENNLTMTDDPFMAVDLYVTLRNIINSML